ncbi:MAG: class II aldolase/adducin family protein [Peptoniphilaceae bacterium]|nr:class II aldolase/adducin family protein [Peptoniphilaceae bacterium]
MVVINIEGKVVEENLRLSSDYLTHLEIYRNFSEIKGVAHTLRLDDDHGPIQASYSLSWNDPCRLLLWGDLCYLTFESKGD